MYCRAILALVLMSYALAGAVPARADALVGEADLRSLARSFESAACDSRCDLPEWTLQRLPMPRGAAALDALGRRLYLLTGKFPDRCGVGRCIEAYVLRDETHLTVLKEGYALTAGPPLSALEVQSSAQRRLVRVARALATPATSASSQGFLRFPLACGDPGCRFRYSAGAETPSSITSVLDHSMVQNGKGFWQYRSASSGGDDGIVTMFDGFRAAGGGAYGDSTCVRYAAEAKPSPLIRPGGCPAGHLSYDEHPGYDYRASPGTPVLAAADGAVLDLSGERCFKSNIVGSCDDWGYVGIDHGNGYITQYGHLDPATISVVKGQGVFAGQRIGLSSNQAPVRLGPHLHFEVLKRVGSAYLVVDPYGWTGGGIDPLYSRDAAGSSRLWRRVSLGVERTLPATPSAQSGAADRSDPIGYCAANPNDDGLGQLAVVPAVVREAKADHWRCVQGRVQVCYGGASGAACLKTVPADVTRRAEFTRFCRVNPNSDIPRALTVGLSTEWACRGQFPAMVGAQAVDGRGFLTAAWRPLTNATTRPIPVPDASGPSANPFEITPDGIGAVKVGMSKAQVQHLLNRTGRYDASGMSARDLWGCNVYAARTGFFEVMLENGQVTSIQTSSSRASTVAGARVGMSLADLRRLYPERLRREANPYTGEDYYLVSPSGNGIRFAVEAGRVRTIFAGGKSIRYVEGCL